MTNKNIKEINLIADYEMEYGQPDNWSDDVVEEFNKKWADIQKLDNS